MGLEDDFLLEDADDEKTVEFIKNYLPQELKEKFEDDELYYFLDLMGTLNIVVRKRALSTIQKVAFLTLSPITTAT